MQDQPQVLSTVATAPVVMQNPGFFI